MRDNREGGGISVVIVSRLFHVSVILTHLAFCLLLPARSQLLGHNFSVIHSLDRVLLEEVCKHHRTHEQNTKPARRCGKTRNVPGRILIWPQPRRVDGRCVANRIDQSNGNGTLGGWLWDNVGHPRFDQWRAAVDGAKGEDGEDVLRHFVSRGGHCDEEDAANAGERADELPFGFVSVC
ncbi:hypothetical protein VTO42DRAFT_2262 [Malbranchea cinnamomea]